MYTQGHNKVYTCQELSRWTKKLNLAFIEFSGCSRAGKTTYKNRNINMNANMNARLSQERKEGVLNIPLSFHT